MTWVRRETIIVEGPDIVSLPTTLQGRRLRSQELLLDNQKYRPLTEMLRLAVEPGLHANPGIPLYPPLIARLSSETSIFSQLSQTWAVATLIHYSGEVLHDQLGGTVTDSAHPLPEAALGTSSSSSNKDRAYFYFPGLVIYEPGQYHIRVSLMRMDYSPDGQTDGVAMVLETVDSPPIVVDNGTVNNPRPSQFIQQMGGRVLTSLGSRERAFIRALREDGQDIPSPH